MRLTVGPLPPTVYWRRRLVVLVGVLLLVVLTVWACAGSNGASGTGQAGAGSTRTAQPVGASSSSAPSVPASPSPSPTPSPSSSPTPSADPSPTGPPGTCPDSVLSLVAAPENATAPSGSYPRLRLTIGNEGTVACTRDLGASQQELRITENNGTVLWSSDYCDAAHGKDVRLFQPGVHVTYTMVWDGRSADKACTKRSVVPPGTYQVIGRLGSKTSKPGTLTLT